MNKRFAGLAAALTLIFAACGGGGDETGTTDESPSPTEEAVSLAIASPDEGASIPGNTVTLNLNAKGVEIVGAKDDPGASEERGHFHVFMDKEPPPVGSTIPVEPGITHSADDPLVIPGLPVGEHTFKVVFGDKNHKRIHDAMAQVKVNVAGPTLDVNAPAEIAANQEGRLEIAVNGVRLVPAADDPGGPDKTGHLHILIDPEDSVLDPILAPSIDPGTEAKPVPPEEENKIIHTTNTVYNVKGLEPGEHTIWVIAGDKSHTPFQPLIADKATILIK